MADQYLMEDPNCNSQTYFFGYNMTTTFDASFQILHPKTSLYVVNIATKIELGLDLEV